MSWPSWTAATVMALGFAGPTSCDALNLEITEPETDATWPHRDKALVRAHVTGGAPPFRYACYLDDLPTACNIQPPYDTSSTTPAIEVGPLSGGTRHVRIDVVDDAGRGASDSVRFTVPELGLTILTPQHGEVFSTSAVTVSF